MSFVSSVKLTIYIYPNGQRQAGPTGAGLCPTIHEPKASWHEFLISLMNAHNLLMLFQRKSLPPCPEATASLSSLTVVWRRLHYSGVKYRVSSVQFLYAADVCFSFQMSRSPRVTFESVLFSDSWVDSGTSPTWHSLVPTVLYSSQHQLHCKSDSNDSLGSLGNQVLRSGEIHFTLQQRDKEMVRQRESGRERGLKKEREWGE